MINFLLVILQLFVFGQTDTSGYRSYAISFTYLTYYMWYKYEVYIIVYEGKIEKLFLCLLTFGPPCTCTTRIFASNFEISFIPVFDEVGCR
jgi:hypothetical protein